MTQVSEELTISQQGQSSDRYDKAIERLDKGSANIRRGAVFSLQGLMEDDPRMQPAVISALSEYIRAHASKKPTTTDKAPDIQAALSVLGQRDPAHDGGRAPDLRGVRLDDVDLRGADLSGANLSGAVLTDSNLQETKLAGADLHGTSLKGTNLRNASLRKANLRKADLTGVDLDGADLASAELAGADLDDVRLDGDTVWTDARRPEGDLPTAQPALSSTPVPTPASSRPGEPQEAGTT